MEFSEKIDFLMKMTGTTNSSLARQLSLDPSYISRLRRGKRKPSGKTGYKASMASYFARRCNEPRSIMLLSDLTGISRESLAETQARTEAIAVWLLEDTESNASSVGGFLNAISSIDGKRGRSGGLYSQPEVPREDPTCVLAGAEGMRKAVIAFLEEVASHGKPCTALLFSDEPMDWLTGDREFAARWSSLMMELAMRGNRIKIVHSLGRNLDEMLTGISSWMPLYMTGAIEPYYYPRKKDGIYRHTLFVAPGISAVVSRSVAGMTREKSVFHIKNPECVKASESEFNAYLKLCRPLMKIFTASEGTSYLKLMSELEAEPSGAIFKSNCLSISTMPESVIDAMAEKAGVADVGGLVRHFKGRKDDFLKNIEKHRFVEIIKMPDMEKILAGEVRAELSEFFGLEGMRYSREEYAAHLSNIVALLKKHSNYEVLFAENEESETIVYAKDGVGVVVAKLSGPFIMFAINESNMTAAFWDYMENEKKKYRMKKKESIAKIRALAEKLESLGY